MDNKTETDNFRIDAARYFSELSRNAGRTGFTVSYTATEGNLDIDAEFKEYCFQYANNEYLAGIGKLLQIARHYGELKALSDYVAEINDRVTQIEERLDKNGRKNDEKEKDDERYANERHAEKKVRATI